MRTDRLRRFARDTRGDVALEAVWCVLILSVFLLPTISLYVITDTRLQSNILLRTGARNQAINYNCSDVALSVPWFFARSDKQSTTTLGCSTLDAESGFSGPVKPYWQRMKTVSSDFPNFLRDFGNNGSIRSVQGTVGVIAKANPNPIAALPTTTPQIIVPVEETWRFSKAPWRNGHDKIIWEKIPNGARPLFEDVFPAKAR